jgi:hypothetical protein
MDEKEFGSIKGWFAGRLPDGWFGGVQVTVEDDQIVVIGTLPAVSLAADATPEMVEGASAGRISRFREETRGERIAIAQDAEERFKKYVTWGATLGTVTKRFTPGGGGRTANDRRVMISRWRAWRHGRRGNRGAGSGSPQQQSQVF